MFQAIWKGRVFSISSYTIRVFQEFGARTDSTTLTSVIEGHELQSLQ